MAHDNEKNAFELRIKVDRQNFSTISNMQSEKCISTLRLPNDPSWPKIPLRRIIDNTNDIIESPYVITSEPETPRKCQSVMQTITCRYPRLSQKYEIATHIPKRLPGCIDPRFKRQILRQKAEKPDESNVKNDKQMQKLDITHVLQETKKSKDKSWGPREILNVYTPRCHDGNKCLIDITKSAKEITDCAVKKQSFLKGNHCIMDSQCLSNKQHDTEDGFSQKRKQDSNRSLLLTVDEKKIYTLPINTLNIEVAPLSAPSLECYNTQIPVIAYHNVPLQIPNISMQVQKDVKISQECQNDNANGQETIGNINVISTLTKSCNKKHVTNSIRQCNSKSNDNDISENKNISYCDRRISDWTCNKENFNLNVSLHQNIINEDPLGRECCINFSNFDNTDDAKNNERSSNLNIIKKLKSITRQGYNTDSCITNRYNESKNFSKRKIAKTRIHSCKSMRERFAYQIKNCEIDADKYPTNIINKTILEKNARVLALSKVEDKQHGKNNNEIKEKHDKLCISVKRKATSIILSKEVKSFFWKRSRLAITNSDYTLVLSDSRQIKRKQYNEKARYRLKANKLLLHRRNEIIASAKPDNVEKQDKHPNKPRYRSLESQTLQQCSVLSCVTNTALGDSMANDERSLNPISDRTFSTCKNVYKMPELSSVFLQKIKQEKMKRASKRLLGLKTMALLGITIYVAIIFLPMIYDYIIDEEYDDYENASYIGLMLQYIVSWFQEISDGIIDILNAIFLRLMCVRFDQRL